MSKRKIGVLIFAGLLFLAACNANRISQTETDIPDGVWNKDSLVKIPVTITDIKQAYDIMVNIRASALYPSNNLWLFIVIESPSGKLQKDTMECIFANERGKWLGDCMGDICDFEIPFKGDVVFPETGIYNFYLQHGMRIDNLPLVLSAGVSLYKHQPESNKDN